MRGVRDREFIFWKETTKEKGNDPIKCSETDKKRCYCKVHKMIDEFFTKIPLHFTWILLYFNRRREKRLAPPLVRETARKENDPGGDFVEAKL